MRRDDFRGQKALLVMFICTHCPYVKHVEKGLAALGMDYDGKPVSIVAISSNDADELSPMTARRVETAGANDGLSISLPVRRDRRQWPRPTTPHARRISFSSMRISSWSIAGSSIGAGPATGFP